jgi:holliday junction DNA helicase RuvB
MEERIVSGEAQGQEDWEERSLRPQSLSQYIGQKTVKENLTVFIEAAKMSGPCVALWTARIGKNNISYDYC